MLGNSVANSGGCLADTAVNWQGKLRCLKLKHCAAGFASLSNKPDLNHITINVHGQAPDRFSRTKTSLKSALLKPLLHNLGRGVVLNDESAWPNLRFIESEATADFLGQGNSATLCCIMCTTSLS
ncbi:hypothetical protein T4B_4236 [Trichinella pseudospiralis]|uniref:Uncharacterized protein n=1 Tax=Trichinella pseudospiralis TaxID=6337 RepID=A0A0V0YL57_TRIPS|nr:hypothetical protein T4E_1231 [Trichinella pseudospiralis]KRY67992.1 hypothetical protein T4A_6993 [Trichinella pseudospiralis]KRZ23404.1 hypothetical protein T4B_4236 [Trichinella pseudospiralis]KRZ40874.1 hypothetical protein T4C_1317 [Trichinella pseudospiralis]